MSIKITQMVWEHAPYAEHGIILVLLALADWANEDGFCWPSMPLLASRARQSRRNITYILKRLENDELIDLQRGNGRGHQTHYRINVERLQSMQPLHPLHPLKTAIVAPIRPKIKGAKGATSDIKGATSDISHNNDARADPLEEPSVKNIIVPTPTLPKKRRQNVKAPPPEQLIPSERLLAWHAKEFPQYDLPDAIESCLDHYRKKGEEAADYEAAIRNWFRNGHKYGTLKAGKRIPKLQE